ncbi:hypothetical protein ONS95_002515 [Cadophora gregata]|uniref:uncharacterized protein n=1 Tax=Cadophora gregata TaxID=51156 RepID=UPI0026DAE10F|nr:uncharacterized protein ONS95_002515 [Cadophora gregata]KAK0109845.1 hypothetical protein ONS95_002515 [Cadophora gregata]KAK0110529.1 hypothetical protein ONS96_002137 [Cadophora gregata f. sp. sojae]
MTLVQTQTICGTLHLDTSMTGYNQLKQSVRTKAGSASGFSLQNGPHFSHGLPGFSLNQTEPTQGQNSGHIWKVEGQQYLHQDPVASQGTTQNGLSDSFNSFHDTQESKTGQYDGRGSFSGSTRSQWNSELAPHLEAVAMSRNASQDSIGAQSQRTTNSYDQSQSARMYPNVSQMSYHMSSASSEVTGRSNSPESSAMYTPTQQMEMQVFDNFPYPGEDFSGAHPMFHRGSTTSSVTTHPIVSLSAGPSYGLYSTAGSESFVPTGSNSIAAQGPVPRDSMMYQAGTILESPTLWDNGPGYLDSQRSSPILLEDPWTLPPTQLATSATNSPFEHSPSVEGISPRYVQDFPDLVDLPPYTTTGDRVMRKPIGPRASKVNSDLAARGQRLPGTSEASDESFKLGGRPNVDLDNTARDHHLYHNVTPQADGLYHCPWEKDPQSNCQHKPEKLKCNYDKFVDSHLKPYKCKVTACKDLQFSSTACLLRHEREAHGLHGHGDKPFLCTYDSCERGLPGNGFPRHWNLRDHMKRVHNDPGQAQSKSNASASPPPSGSIKNKKRKADSVESSVMYKAPKRISTPPAVIRQPQEPSLIDRYQEKHQALQDLVNQLVDPTRVDNISLLRNAMDCIKVMAQTTQRINAAPVMGQHMFTQQSG